MLKYRQQIDEADFLAKAEARIGSDDCLDPVALATALNSEPALRIHDAGHDRLIQLQLKVHTVSSFAELQRCIQRWPGTSCAVVALADGGCASGTEQLVAAYREAYGDQQMLVGKTRVKATGRAGPLRAFGEEGFITAVVLEPVIVRMLKYEPEPNLMLDLQLPCLSPEYDKGVQVQVRATAPPPAGSGTAAASLAARTCRAMEGLAPGPGMPVDGGMEGTAASAILLTCELMVQHPADAEVQAAGCNALRRLFHLAVRALPTSEARNCVELVAAAMRRHSLSEEVQDAACVALASMVQVRPELQSVVATNGGIEQVVMAMCQFPDSAKLQSWACAALAALAAKHPMNQSAIAASRGLDGITAAMQDHPDNAELQVMACGAFGNLAASHPNNQSAIAACGGLACIAGTMALHQEAVQVQQSGTAAIWCLVNEHPENQQAACALRATDLITLAIRRFGGRPEGQALKSTAAGALQCLIPGFSSALTAASSVYTAGAFGLPQQPPSRIGAGGGSVMGTARSNAPATFRWARPPTGRSAGAPS